MIGGDLLQNHKPAILVNGEIALSLQEVASIAGLFSTLERLNLYEGPLSGIEDGGLIIRPEMMQVAASMSKRK